MDWEGWRVVGGWGILFCKSSILDRGFPLILPDSVISYSGGALKLHIPAADLSDFVLRAAFSSDRDNTPSSRDC